jgi:hypothetical protein
MVMHYHAPYALLQPQVQLLHAQESLHQALYKAMRSQLLIFVYLLP